MLMDQEMKDKLLSVEWDQELLDYVYDFFDKYEQTEEDVSQYIAANSHKIVINYIHELEKYEREDLVKRLEELRKLIMLYRRDI